MNLRPSASPIQSGAGALLILAVLVLAGGLDALAPDRYYQTVQEDSYVEWLTFWSFTLAAAVLILRALRARLSGQWFILSVAAFCLFVALEEISWGQRVLGFRPPTYFLGNNFQQELNFHNILASHLRELAVELTILVYGIVLPLSLRICAVGPHLERWNVVSPPLALAPAFAAMLIVYVWYPWEFSGEWVELALGLGFLFAAVGSTQRRERQWDPHPPRQALQIAAACGLVGTLGVATTIAQGARVSNDPSRIVAARLELAALGANLEPLVTDRCGIHKRVYTAVRDRRWKALEDGQYARLAASGVPQARIDFQLDPWNSPYWVRCIEGVDANRVAHLYSFGPNRRRDSTEHGIAGDDVGIALVLDARGE